jgi:hypothetical protein
VLSLALLPAAAVGFVPTTGRVSSKWLTVGRVTRLSEIEEESDKYDLSKNQQYLDENAGIKEQADSNQGPVNYDNFIDGEGFDGGDGQVGVVDAEGETGNNMPEFDDSSTTYGMQSQASMNVANRGGVLGSQSDDALSESKKTQRNAFGTFSGYAEELAEQGMVEYDDETGEDRLLARRQQLENWRNQRELRSQQQDTLTEMSGYTGTEYDPRAGAATYMNALNANVEEDDSNWNVYKGDAKAVALEGNADGLVAGDITETIEVVTQFPKPSFYEIKVENDVISFEEFVVGFAAGSDEEDFQISPTSGELNRRGGDPQILSLVFKPQAPGGTRQAKIVVQTEETKWTYQILGTVQ